MLRKLGILSLAAALLASCRDADGPLAPVLSELRQLLPASTPSGVLYEKRFERGKGEPATVTEEVRFGAVVPRVWLRIGNGSADGEGRVSSATVTVDGEPVVRPSDLSQQVGSLLVPVDVRADRLSLGVTLAGKPGAFLTLAVERGSPVGSDGGTLQLEGGAVTIEVPAGAVDDEVVLTADPLPPEETSSLAGVAYDFGPDGQRFAEPITVTLPAPSTTPSWTSPDKLTLVWDSLGQWIPLRDVQRNADGTLSGKADHFTVIGVGTTEVRVCKDDPTGIHELADGLAAVANGGRVVLCDGDYTAREILVRKPVTVENEPGAAPRVVAVDSFPIQVDSVPRGQVVFRGLSFSGHGWAAIWIGAIYDDVLVENSSFVSAPEAHGVFATNTEVPGGRVTLRNIQVTGGATGVFAHNAPRFDVLDSRFSGQVFSGIQVQTNTNGTISGNTVEQCGQLGCIRVRLAGDVHVTDNTLRTTSRSDAFGNGRGVQFGIVADGRAVRVERNLVEGLGTVADPGDAAAYPIQDVGILAQSNPNAATHVVVNANTVRNAARGIYASVVGAGPQQAVSAQGQDNRVSQVQVATGSRGGARIVLHRNDFTDFHLPLTVLEVPDGAQPIRPGDLTCNWWGRAEGPIGAPEDVPIGAYTPAAGQPIAGQPGVSCDPTPAPAPTAVRVCPDGSAGAVPSFRTLEGGLAQVASGGTVELCGQTHVAAWVRIPKPVTLQAEGTSTPVLDGGGQRTSLVVEDMDAGPVTIRGLKFQNAEVENLKVQGAYDRVVIENSEFSPSRDPAPDPGPLGYRTGINVTGTTSGNGVTIRNNVFRGGDIGVSVWRASAVTVLGNQFYAQANAAVHVAEGSARVEGNVVSGCGTEWCVGFFSADDAQIVGNRVEVGFSSPTRTAIFVHAARAAVERNEVVGTGGTSDPDAPSTWPITFSGIGFYQTPSAVVSGNQVSNAYAGLWFDQTTAIGQDNRIDRVRDGIGGWGPPDGPVFNRVTITRSDITNYTSPLDGRHHMYSFEAADFTCNWWGDATGPQNLDPAVAPEVVTPFATAAIAGTGRTCP